MDFVEMRKALDALALDVLSMASAGGMPDSYWLTDERIGRACSVLGVTPEEGRALADRGR